MQARKLIARALCENFHAAVVIVPYPSRDAEQVRLALDEPAESNALHTSANQKAASLNGFICD